MRNPGLILVALVLGCAPPMPPEPPRPLVAFNPAEVEWAKQPGTSTVEGQAFLKTRGGDVKYGAGNKVFLIPNTAHTFDWFTRAVDGKFEPKMDTAVSALTRSAVAGGDGKFKFENVPAGMYLAVTTVTWLTATGYRGSAESQGGVIGMPVTVENGKTVSVIITR